MSAAKEDKELTAMQSAYNALKDLDGKLQRRIIEWLTDKLEIASPVLQQGLDNTPAKTFSPAVLKNQAAGAPLDPKVFMTSKRPQNINERITCLAYFLTHFRDMKQFKTVDLTKLNTEASQPKISNPTYYARDAADAQFLSLAGGGKKQITARGEALVEALPDRAAVTAALENHPLVGRKGSKHKKTNSAKVAKK